MRRCFNFNSNIINLKLIKLISDTCPLQGGLMVVAIAQWLKADKRLSKDTDIQILVRDIFFLRSLQV